MTFEEVEHVLGIALPPSAYKHRPWWANEAAGHVHAKAWLEAGYETGRVDMQGKKLVFKRIAASKGSGMSDSARAFTHTEGEGRKPVARHPLIGAMKGLTWSDPNYDLTQPMFSDKEWDEIVEEKLKKYDELFGGPERK
jgi:hypothetical protein